MKKKEETQQTLKRRATLSGIMLIVVAAIALEVTNITQYIYSRRVLKQEAAMRAESQLATTRAEILDVIDQAEAAVRNSIWIASWCLDFPDSLQVVSRRIVEENPVVVGSTVALVPGYDPKHPLFSPYVCREAGTGKIVLRSLATEDYDYPSQEWFTQPVETGEGYWSEPYIDEGGGEILMTTYSVPVLDADGRVAAVLTADISLDWLTELMAKNKVYPHSHNMVVSRTGQMIVTPIETLATRNRARELGTEAADSASVEKLIRAMLSGTAGNMDFSRAGRSSEVFYRPVERTGWSLSIIIPDFEIYGSIKRMGVLVKLLQLLGLLLLLLILRAAAKNQRKYERLNENKKRMENELKIGHNIQMSMLPKTFPPFPERSDIDMSACLISAKEVGGDLYDFYIRDEKLYFCIGDVSGKGVPASLVMAVTRSLFRTVSTRETSTARIVTAMNDSMADMNENNMFVTFFCGILDLRTGHLRYCNAGHNPPMILSDKIRSLPVEPNLPLGILPGMEFQEQATDLAYDDALFLYTDGVTEAENSDHELFGEERMEAVLHTRRDAADHLSAMKDAVAAFVGDAPQSDDLTMLFIHYLSEEKPEGEERHLVLHNDVREISRLADFVEDIADKMQLDPGLALNLNLALEEAVTNVVLYAYPEGTEGTVDIGAFLSKDAVEFTVTDSGVAFDPTLAPEADTTLGVEERPVGGLGIFLVRKIMDTVRYKRAEGKNILTMTKKI